MDKLEYRMKIGVLLWFLSILPLVLPGQSPRQDSVPGKTIHIIQSDELEFEAVNGVSKKGLHGNVILEQDDVLLFCDKATMRENKVIARGNVVIEQDSATIYADRADYNGGSRKANLLGNVILHDHPNKLVTNRLDYDLNSKVAHYTTGAVLSNDRAELKSKHGYYYTKTKEAYFEENVHLVDSNFTLVADTLRYNTESKIAYFQGPTHLNVDGNKIYCEEGYYDTEKNYAEFMKNAWIEQDSQRADADKIVYDGNLEKVDLLGRTTVVRDNQSIFSDNAYYNEATGNSVFTDNVQVIDQGRIIFADTLEYNSETDNGWAVGNVWVQDVGRTVFSDSLKYDKDSGLATVVGNVFIVDTLRDLSIVCGRAEYEDSTSYILATGRPFLTTLVGEDSLYLSADTLVTFEDEEGQSFKGRKNVLLYKSDLQAVCESLDYNERDSTFHFNDNPVLWSDTTQFVADTIKMRLKNDVIDGIDLLGNALIINTPDEQYFNQIKGKNVFARFRDSEIREMDVKGNGEVIYYVLDEEDAYIGVNQVNCGFMLVYFGSNEVETIKFYGKPKATVTPMGQINHNTLRLNGFDWKSSLRPKGPWDVRRLLIVEKEPLLEE